jgi:protein gp37
MGKTNISWTDFTFNPWWGCMKVSPGCENCYALTLATRWGHDIWGPAKTTSRRLFSSKHWQEPVGWDRDAEQAGERRRVFCASMADVFEDHPLLNEPRQQLWDLIYATPNLDWLLLTKRPENVASMLPGGYWPNVWLGTSTEDQQRADERVPILLRHRDQVPVLFLSVEPQLGPITFRWASWNPLRGANHLDGLRQLDWIISGGESGPKHRPFDLNWARQTRDECRAAGVAWHFKQFGGRTHAEGGCMLDGEEIKEFPTPRLREFEHA